MPNVSEITSMKDIAIERLAWARGFTHRIVEGLSDDQLTARAGGKGNHALWVMGHLADSEDAIVSAVDASPRVLDASFAKLFAGGTDVSDDASAYPARGELLEAMQAARQRTIKWIESLDDASVRRAAPEPLLPFAPDAISTAFTIPAHELCHAGQLLSVRAALGLPRLFM